MSFNKATKTAQNEPLLDIYFSIVCNLLIKFKIIQNSKIL